MVSLRTIAISAVAFGLPLAQALTPQQIVNNIKTLTRKSANLQVPAKEITVVNAPLLLVGLGPIPKVVTGFVDIVTTATTMMGTMTPEPITAAADAALVADAFREFVRVHQVLLNILIGKAGLLQTIPFVGAPVAAVLRQVENIVDTIAFALIDMISAPGQKSQIEADGDTLTADIERAADSYDGLNVKVKRSFVA